jgi:hypothetical protein
MFIQPYILLDDNRNKERLRGRSQEGGSHHDFAADIFMGVMYVAGYVSSAERSMILSICTG